MDRIIFGKSAEIFKDEFEKRKLPFSILPFYEKIGNILGSHADSLVFETDGKILTFDDYYNENRRFFDSLGKEIITTKENVGSIYPNDILLNALFVNGKIYARKDKISKLIRDKYECENVRQGYSRCSSLVINYNSVISADPSIEKALLKDGVDFLKISEDHIVLENCDYGFIGGAGFYYDGILYFFGRIEDHPDYEKIKDFAQKRSTGLVSLGRFPLTDCGGALVLHN